MVPVEKCVSFTMFLIPILKTYLLEYILIDDVRGMENLIIPSGLQGRAPK
jgi:hypothetical protein